MIILKLIAIGLLLGAAFTVGIRTVDLFADLIVIKIKRWTQRKEMAEQITEHLLESMATEAEPAMN